MQRIRTTLPPELNITELFDQSLFVRAAVQGVVNEALIAMGMKSAFKDPRQPDGANFRGMTDSQDPNDQLCIALVRHKAFVDVNEEGTEAAAATAVVMSLTAAMVEVLPFTPVFRADRPFLYLIRDVGTDCLLFVGRMTKP